MVADALSWFAQLVPSGPLPGYVYGGSLERNQLLPTAVGALRPSALVPETMANGEASGLQRVCIVGTRALRDFHPSLCAANLVRAGIDARAVSLELKLERADMNALGLARHFDDEQWRRQFCAELSLTLRADEAVGLPAMLGLRDPHEVLADVEHRLGRRVFEIPTLPPSVPGMRLYEILRAALRAAGGRLVLGAEVVSAARDGDRITSVATRAAGRDLHYAAPWFVLATGGFASGGIELDSALGHARAGAGPAPARGPRRGRGAVREPLSRRAAPGAGGRGRRLGPARRGRRERGGRRRRPARGGPVARGLGRGDRAGQRLPRRAGGRGPGVAEGGDRMSDSGGNDLFVAELLRGSLDHCVKCTICETACPVSNATPLFPGPKYAGPQSERYRIADEPSVDVSVDYCSGCGICSQVCPQGVKIAEINAQARNKLKRQKGFPLRDRIITRPTWLGRAGTPVAPIANFTLRFKPLRILGREGAGRSPRRARAEVRRATVLALGP